MRRFYRGVIVVMFICCLSLLVVGSKKYKDLQRVNENTSKLLEKQRKSNAKVVKEWEQGYYELEDKYIKLLNRKNKASKKSVKYSKEEVYMLAKCVEAEAGSHDKSQKYVTQVILNRVNSDKFPNSLKEVIYQKNGNIPQFSVAYNGMMNRKVRKETLANVYSVLMHGTNLPKYVHYFYDESVTGNWVNTLNIYDTVGGTVFAYESKED